MDDNQPYSVDELRRMIVSPAETSPSRPSAVEQQGGLGVADLQRMTEPKPRPTVGFGEDIARATGAGLSRGAVGLTGLPGDVETLARYGGRKAGLDIGQESFLPTSEEMIKKAETYIPGAKEFMEYKPQYAPSKYAKTAAEFVPGALLGPGGLGTKVAGSVGAGVASQGVEDWMKGTQYEGTPTETALKIAASIPGYGLGAKSVSSVTKPFAGAITPEAEAAKRLAGTMGSDIAKGTQKTIPSVAGAEGEVPVAGFAGEKTRKLIQSASERAPEKASGAFTAAAEESRSAAPRNVQAHIDETFGAGSVVNPFDLQETIKRDARLINSQNYQNAFSAPTAQNIIHPDLNKVVSALPQNTLQEVADSLRMGFVDPASVGLVKTKGGWQINPNGMPLEFWDAIKRDLDNKILMLKDPITGASTNPEKTRLLNNQNQILKSTLDNVVPEYATARGAAAEALGHTNAVDLGMGFLTTSNEKKLNAMYNVFNKLPPEQKENAAYGLAGAYRRMMETNPDAAFKLFTGPKANEMQNRFRAIMGSDADALIGRTLQENLNRNIQSLRAPSGFSGSQFLPYATGAAGAVATLGETLLQPALWAGNPAAIASTLGFYGLGKAYNWKEARVASKVLELAQDPNRAAELAKLAASDPNARSFLEKTATILARAGAGVESGRGQNEPQQSAGGRIGRASGGSVLSSNKADRLIKAAESAKKAINSRTEVLLDQPDEKIASALAIAKRHI
jgi:hypothetical protein